MMRLQVNLVRMTSKERDSAVNEVRLLASLEYFHPQTKCE